MRSTIIGARRLSTLSIFLFSHLTLAGTVNYDPPARSLPRPRQASSPGVAMPPGYRLSQGVEQCTVPIPALSFIGARHTYLNFDNHSVGMPFSLFYTDVDGGPAVIYSQDPWGDTSRPNVTCYPVYQPEQISSEEFNSRVRCLSQKLSASEIDYNSTRSWYGLFKYSWDGPNCHATIRYLMDCAGGALSLNPNEGIGSDYSPNQPALLVQPRPNGGFYDRIASTANVYERMIHAARLADDASVYLSQSKDYDQVVARVTQEIAMAKRYSGSFKTSQSLWAPYGWQLTQFNSSLALLRNQQSKGRMTAWAFNQYMKLLDLFKDPAVSQSTYGQLCLQARNDCGIH